MFAYFVGKQWFIYWLVFRLLS